MNGDDDWWMMTKLNNSVRWLRYNMLNKMLGYSIWQVLHKSDKILYGGLFIHIIIEKKSLNVFNCIIRVYRLVGFITKHAHLNFRLLIDLFKVWFLEFWNIKLFFIFVIRPYFRILTMIFIPFKSSCEPTFVLCKLISRWFFKTLTYLNQNSN